VSWGVPSCLVGIGRLGNGEKRLLVNSGVSRLVESQNVDVVVLVFLDNSSSVIIGVERVHEDERNIDTVSRVEVLFRQPLLHFDKVDTHLNLPNGQVKESHALPNFNDGLGSNTTHGSTETTVQLQDSKLVEDCGVDIG
jgi:hypothetical protein